MRKLFICCLLLCLLSGCTSNLNDYEDSRKTEAYDGVYEEGYERGYEEGMQYVLTTLRENANDWDRYMNVEDIECSLHIYFEDSSVDVDEARDAIIYHPDFEHYTLEALLEELIKENID